MRQPGSGPDTAEEETAGALSWYSGLMRHPCHNSLKKTATNRKVPKVGTAPYSVTDPPTLQKYNAAISTPFTTKFALYNPRKSRSCCSRVAQRPAKTAAGKAMALQTTA